MDYKLACAAVMLERWRRFDPAKGIQFATFAHHDVKNSLLRARMLEEAGSLRASTSTRKYGAWARSCMALRSARRSAVRKKRGCSKRPQKVFENCPAHSERVFVGERR
ncbi:MAG: hypothetical protein ACLUEK_02245 [Oscillospiraceae bacterium]